MQIENFIMSLLESLPKVSVIKNAIIVINKNFIFPFIKGIDKDKKVQGNKKRPKASEVRNGVKIINIIQAYLNQHFNVNVNSLGRAYTNVANTNEKTIRLSINNFQSQ